MDFVLMFFTFLTCILNIRVEISNSHHEDEDEDNDHPFPNERMEIGNDSDGEEEIDEDRLWDTLNLMEADLAYYSQINWGNRHTMVTELWVEIMKHFEYWNLEQTVALLLFRGSNYIEYVDCDIEGDTGQILKAENVAYLGASSTLREVEDVVTTYSQAEVLLQLKFEYDLLSRDGTEIAEFHKKIEMITLAWGMPINVSYDVISVSGGVQVDTSDVRDGGSPVAVVDLAAAANSSRKQRVHHHKRHLSRSSSVVDNAPGNALINELGNPDNMFVTENGTVVTSQIGGTAILPCATVKPGTATVSWMRRIDYTILTIGTKSYSSDKRFYVDHTRHLKTWNLEITPVEASDAGLYECRIATHPTTSNFVHLKVTEARAEILGSPDLYIMSGSSLRLVCRLQGSTQAPLFVFWYHSDRMINFDTDRGLVVHINSTESDLIMPYTNTSDSGNYTCQPQNISPATIHVHVLQSEVPAAMQHGVRSSTSGSFAISNCAIFTLIYILLQMLS